MPTHYTTYLILLVIITKRTHFLLGHMFSILNEKPAILSISKMDDADIFELRSYSRRRRHRRFFNPVTQANTASIQDLREKLQVAEAECQRRQDLLRDARHKTSTLKKTVETLRNRLKQVKKQEIDVLKKMPSHIVDRLWKTRSKDPECTSCLQEIHQKECYFLTACGHDFCNICIVRWTAQHSTCPVCRENVLNS